MASPLVTFKQMFSLMKRETHHHPEVRHVLAQEVWDRPAGWMDLHEEDYAERLKRLKAKAETTPDDQEAA